MRILKVLTITIIAFSLFSTKIIAQEKYSCTPCGRDCDKTIHNKPGKCTECKMELVKSSTIHFKNIEPSAICAYMKAHPNTLLLDVRTPAEFEGKGDPDFGTLKNAINIPVQELPKRLAEIKEYKNKEIIVFCSHSHRSPQAAYTLTQNGFTNVTNMSGGMSEMKDEACKK
jgi:rhodanese-related sulfurtransferase